MARADRWSQEIGWNRGRRMRDEGAGHPPRRCPSKVSDVTEAFIESDGVRLWTVSQGVGDPVVHCNGGPGLADYLEPVAAMIDDFCRVIRFDQRGSGRSVKLGGR